MAQFTVRLWDRNNLPIVTTLRLRPLRYAWSDMGGPETAEIGLEGSPADLVGALRWLGGSVRIVGADGMPVWWGIVHEASFVADGMEYGLSMDGMANRVAVIYASNGLSAITDWEEDTRSTDLYGDVELIHSLGNATPAQAEAAAASILAQKAWPRRLVRVAQGSSAGGRLLCVGKYTAMGWRYYANSIGRVAFEGEKEGEAIMGWGFADSQLVGFHGKVKRICQLSCAMTGLRVDDKIVVSGSTSNNGTFTVVEEPTVDDQVIYDGASGVYFEVTDDIKDTNDLLDQFTVGEMFRLENTASNDGFWFWRTVGPDACTVRPNTVANEAVGSDTKLTQGNSVKVAETVTQEGPNLGVKYVTILAHGQKVDQSFTVNDGGTWTVGEVAVWVRRMGSPGDSLKVEICADSAGAPGTVLDSATVLGSSLTTRSTKLQVMLNRTATLSTGTYHLVVSRTGAASATDYYLLSVDEEAGYSGGVLRLYTGSAWATRTVDADLHFEVWGHRETTAIIAEIATAYIGGASIRTAAGVYDRMYRAGTKTALDEVERLLAAGTSSGARLLAMVSADDILIVEQAPATAAARWRNGRFTNVQGQPLARGLLPVGQWVALDTPIDDDRAPFSPLWLARCEYDVAGDTITPGFADLSVWQVGELDEG